ncbi:30S ribosomal protein S1 [Paenibacillus aestuarii]|uniref:30S ribosomal protein S1 n=1 Tax=Paenibacillus aestuarii TaxID=516965 RepID=A0ABW0K6X9_9BACL
MAVKEQFDQEDLQVSRALGWADIKESQKIKGVLYAQAIGIEEIPVNGKIQECLKLNYQGNYGYLPPDLIDEYDFRGLQGFLGKEFEFVVQHVDLESHLFVANRKEALTILAQKFWKTAKEGEVYEAFVRGVDPYNLYVIVNGVRAKLYRDEFSYSFVEDLREEVEIGDIIHVKITKLVKPGQKFKRMSRGKEIEAIADERGYLELSSRLLENDPWTNIVNYKEGATYLGTITKVHMEHGLFIQLEPGLVVRTNFPPNSRGALLRRGRQVNVKLVVIDAKMKSMKALVITPKKGVGEKSFGRRGLVR